MSDKKDLVAFRALVILILSAAVGVCVGLPAGVAANSVLAGIGAGVLAGLTAAKALQVLVGD